MPTPDSQAEMLAHARRRLTALSRALLRPPARRDAVYLYNFNAAADAFFIGLPPPIVNALRNEFPDLCPPGTARRRDIESSASTEFLQYSTTGTAHPTSPTANTG